MDTTKNRGHDLDTVRRLVPSSAFDVDDVAFLNLHLEMVVNKVYSKMIFSKHCLLPELIPGRFEALLSFMTKSAAGEKFI